jgi:hypothetical protein
MTTATAVLLWLITGGLGFLIVFRIFRSINLPEHLFSKDKRDAFAHKFLFGDIAISCFVLISGPIGLLAALITATLICLSEI